MTGSLTSAWPSSTGGAWRTRSPPARCRPARPRRLVCAVAEAVHYAHSRGVIHRDLKPANILLDADGRPQVTDFGLAKRLEGDSVLTASGQMMGTPSYMAPEQAAGQADVGIPADVYGLGAVLYHLLTGRPPFQAASTVETLVLVRDRDPVTAAVLNPGVPIDLETIALKCLQKSPAARYADAAAVADDLRRFAEDRPIVARPITTVQRLDALDAPPQADRGVDVDDRHPPGHRPGRTGDRRRLVPRSGPDQGRAGPEERGRPHPDRSRREKATGEALRGPDHAGRHPGLERSARRASGRPGAGDALVRQCHPPGGGRPRPPRDEPGLRPVLGPRDDRAGGRDTAAQRVPSPAGVPARGRASPDAQRRRGAACSGTGGARSHCRGSAPICRPAPPAGVPTALGWSWGVPRAASRSAPCRRAMS